jgi:hypothetical protein
VKRASCAVIAEPGTRSGELDQFVRALTGFGIAVADTASLCVYVGGEAGKLPAPLDMETTEGSVLRVRRVASNRSAARASFDWPHEVALELAAWLIAAEPPQPVTVDVTVPVHPHSGIPRWRSELLDNRRISIAMHTSSGAPLTDETRIWAEHLIRTMASRWTYAIGRCECCA